VGSGPVSAPCGGRELVYLSVLPRTANPGP